MSNTLGPQRKRTRTVRRSTRRVIVAVNITEAVVALPCLVAAYGLAERLVAAQETASRTRSRASLSRTSRSR